LLPIYSSGQIKEWDNYTIQTRKISSHELMETAASQFVNWFVGSFDSTQPVLIFCGNGNNGGDGLAIARLLHVASFKVKVTLISLSEKSSVDYEKNLMLIENLDIEILNEILEVEQFCNKTSNLVLIDAIFGYGLNKEVNDNLLKWFDLINNSRLKIISVDIPSGMYADKMTNSTCIHSDYTLTFQTPKLCQLIPETGRYCGEFIIKDIKLDPAFISDHPPKYNFIEQSDIRQIYKPRNPFDWKNKYGHILTIGGNYGMAGAIILSARASLHSGCGLCSVHSIDLNREIIQAALPEAIFVSFDKIDLSKYNSIVIGPGYGIDAGNVETIISILNEYKKPIVLDADALNLVSSGNLFSSLNQNCILTPHAGEFDRLFGKSANGFDRLDKAIEKAIEYKIHIILKGKHTAIVTPDGMVYFNSTGNVGLAKGGSGDVLSGILGAMLAQGYSHLNACIMATYIHGLAADISAEHIAVESILPSDVIQNISNAFIKIQK
jgi:hydroxyethylthiazole kinase-like uncharacterized protein yjeF